ncbi:hypothetical protein evm_008813 [Chilo suppressalis]|nr:hypothetical protein evm_008813 [Chilo suppressalis]
MMHCCSQCSFTAQFESALMMHRQLHHDSPTLNGCTEKNTKLLKVLVNIWFTGLLPINVPTAGAQAFPMDGIGRLGLDPPRGPSADWWVLTTAEAAGTNGLTCLPKHGGTRDRRFLVTRPMTDHCESCLTSTIAAERANHQRHRAPHLY